MKRSKKNKTEKMPVQNASSGSSKFIRYLNDNKELLAILVLSLILYIYTFDVKLDLNGDNVGYYLLGKSIAQGKGFSSIWAPDSPPHSYWPIGYPVIISIAMKLGLKSIEMVKVVNFVLLCGVVIFSFLFVKNITQNKIVALVTALCLGINSHMLHYANIIMSEIPYLFFCVLTFYFISKIDFEKPIIKNYYLLASIITISFSFYIRSIGFVLLFAVLIYYLLAKKWKIGLITAFGFVVLYLPYYLRNYFLGVKGSSYLQQVMWKNPYRRELGKMELWDFFERIFNNILRYVSIEIPTSVLTFLQVHQASLGSWLAGIICCLIILWGIFRLEKYKFLVMYLFVGIFGVLLLWPEVWFGIRFILTLFPFIIFLIVYGIFELIKKLNLNPKLLYGFGILYFLVHMSTYSNLNRAAQRGYPGNYANYFNIALWANENTNSNDVFVARKPKFFYLFSNRKTFMYKSTPDDQELLRDLQQRNAKYVVIEQLGFGSTPRYLVPAVQKNSSRFSIIYHLRNPDTYLLEFIKTNLGEKD